MAVDITTHIEYIIQLAALPVKNSGAGNPCRLLSSFAVQRHILPVPIERIHPRNIPQHAFEPFHSGFLPYIAVVYSVQCYSPT